MIKEDKELLLKDLCARLPYGVKCRQFKLDSQICTLTADLLDKVDNLEPYLRPRSEIANLISAKEFTQLSGVDLIDWYNTNHIDYRELIEKGLAIEAPADMYK